MTYKGYSRRDFIKTAVLGSAALNLGCIARSEKYIPNIGVQLWTVREAMKYDFEGAIKQIADMGFIGVETYEFHKDIGLEKVANTIKDAGLKIFACHCDLPDGERQQDIIEMAQAYGSDRLIYHGWPGEGKFGNQDELNKTVETYNRVSEELKAHGIKFGIHNHWWEFEMAESGVIPYYYLLENLNEDFFFEIDTYWAQTAGFDVVKAITDFGKRAPLLHIKDGVAKKGPKQGIHVPVGMGAMDIPAIAKAGGENIKWMVVEFDDFVVDIFKGLKQSYDYLTKNGLAKGNL